MAPLLNPPSSASEPIDASAALMAKETKHPGQTSGDEDDDLFLKVFRALIADLCQQFGGGHPGGAMGMAAIGLVLWRDVMRFSPHNPGWFARDRFVLSNGHTCLWQYTFLHLVGFRHMTLDKLKLYHSHAVDNPCPGHPEIEHDGIEVTTGPLGQGVANAVGLAMATKHLAATYHRPGHENLIANTTWCLVGDACLQEGVALEAISLAGHWKLDNLVVIYDNNQITCDGSVDLTNTEDIDAKMHACGWNVLSVDDGCYNVQGIRDALLQAKAHRGSPTFINVKTIIGVGSAVAGDAAAHGAALGQQNVDAMKRAYGFDPAVKFHIPAPIRAMFADCIPRGRASETEWDGLLGAYRTAHPALAAELEMRMAGQLPPDWASHIPATFPSTPTPSRKSAGAVLNPLAAAIPSFMVGTADLTPSVNMAWPSKTDFNPPSLTPHRGAPGSYAGRYIHWGIREHAMAAVSNGLAAFHPRTILPVTSSFFIFYLYAAPAVRMGALQRLPVLHIATHDSIGAGEDGPTHQPVELAALFRAMPTLLYLRPADAEEVAGAIALALDTPDAPALVSVSRHAVPQFPGRSSREGVRRGGYVFGDDDPAAVVTLIGSGAEMGFAVGAAEALADRGVRTRVVSIPCWSVFARQDVKYRRGVLRRGEMPAVVVEAYAATGWERWADAGVTMQTFGHSLPGPAAYRHFGFEAGAIAEKVEGFLREWNAGRVERGEFVEL